jgi:hypothetical protein
MAGMNRMMSHGTRVMRRPRRAGSSVARTAVAIASAALAPLAVLPGRAARGGLGVRRGLGLACVEAALAAAAFAVLCTVVLSVAPQLGVEPDDGAYRASIVAMTEGDFLTLSTAQADTLARMLDDNPAAPPNQWVELPSGRNISEKDPGYPFLAAPFQALGIIRWAPLFYGMLACFGLFAGARRWLGRFGGLAAVGLYCSSGAALLFAWRDYMPTFTDASLIAAGSGALLWALLATGASSRWRTWAGLAGFVAIEIATFVRYTNVVILGCAVVAVTVAWRLRAAKLPLRTLCWWLTSAAVFGAGVAVFDDLVYGGPLWTGYRFMTGPNQVRFGLGAIVPNLRYMPAHLIQAMPMLVLGLAALAWIIARAVAMRRAGAESPARRDLWAALGLAASLLAIWGVYSAYYWTNDPSEDTLQTVRFYVPAIGATSLLGAWLVTRIPGRAWLAGLTSATVVAVMFVLGAWSFHAMVAGIGTV